MKLSSTEPVRFCLVVGYQPETGMFKYMNKSETHGIFFYFIIHKISIWKIKMNNYKEFAPLSYVNSLLFYEVAKSFEFLRCESYNKLRLLEKSSTEAPPLNIKSATKIVWIIRISHSLQYVRIKWDCFGFSGNLMWFDNVSFEWQMLYGARTHDLHV